MIRTGKSLSRRHVLQVATASVSLALLALAGCSSPPVAQPTASSASTAPTAKPAVAAPAAQPAQQSVGSVTIQYFAWGEENGAWAQLIKDFQAKTPNITVSLTPAPTNDF